MTGLTIPCFDLLDFKKGYSPSRPWLYEDFDQLTFYLVSEDELEAQLAKFKMGTYEYEFEEVLFDMAEHNALLESTKEEVKALKQRQHEAQAVMAVREKESMELWKSQQARMEIPVDDLQELLADPEIEALQAPMNANVWKVLVKEGDVLEKDQVVVILEAMKLEINIQVDDELVGSKVELVTVQPGDSVVAGDNVVLARKGYAKF
jgi:urea carboxylase